MGDADKVEEIIDKSRISKDWEAVLKGIEQYTSILDEGKVTSTQLHTSIQTVQAFYWTCVGECLYESKGDTQKSFDCIHRAYSVDKQFLEWKIIWTRIILVSLKDSIRSIGNATNCRISEEYDSEKTKKLEILLSNYWKKLPSTSQKLIQKIVNLQDAPSDLILNSMRLFDASEKASICDLIINHKVDENLNKEFELYKLWIYLISNRLLKSITITTPSPFYQIFRKFSEKKLSHYSLVLLVDAIICRSLIHESLGDLLEARADLELLTENLINPLKASEWISLPEKCQLQLVYAACRLPLIRTRAGTPTDVLKAYDLCAGEKSMIKEDIPIPLFVGLIAEISMYHLVIVMQRTAQVKSVLLQNGGDISSIGLDSVVVGGMTQACKLLSLGHTMLTDQAHTNNALLSPSQLMEPMRVAVTHEKNMCGCFPQGPTDPVSLGLASHGGVFSTLMSAILVFSERYNCRVSLPVLDQTANNLTKRLSTWVEWGLTLEIRPSVELLWNLSVVKANCGFKKEAIYLLKQCHHTLVTDAHSGFGVKAGMKDMVFGGRFEGVLSRMGLPQACVSRPWLPASLVVQLVIQLEVDDEVKDGLKMARDAIRIFYGEEGEAILTAVGDVLIDDDGVFMMNKLRFNSHPSYGLGDKYKPTDLEATFENAAVETGVKNMLDSVATDDERGLRALILQLAVCHAKWGDRRCACDWDKVQHHRIAVKLLKLLLPGVTDEEIAGKRELSLELTDEDCYSELVWSVLSSESSVEVLTLHYARSLAEVGETSTATEALRSVLKRSSEIDEELEKQLMHMLALTITANSDSPESVAAAAVLVKKVVEADEKGWNSRTTLAVLQQYAGDDEAAERTAQHILHQVKQAVSFYTNPNQQVSDENTPNSPGSVSSKATGASGVSRKKLQGLKRLFPSLENKRMMTSVLISLSRVYREINSFSAAQQCLEEAWKILFLLNDGLRSRLSDFSSGLAKEHDQLETLRHVPTLLGWRLPEGCGWAAHHHFDCEADILVECALLIQQEEENQLVPRAEELFQLALSTFPEHSLALVGLSGISLEKFRRKFPIQGEEKRFDGRVLDSLDVSDLGVKQREERNQGLLANADDIALAQHYAKTALLSRDLSSEAWAAYGLSMEIQGFTEEAVEAFLWASDCEHLKPIRSFQSALW